MAYNRYRTAFNLPGRFSGAALQQFANVYRPQRERDAQVRGQHGYGHSSLPNPDYYHAAADAMADPRGNMMAFDRPGISRGKGQEGAAASVAATAYAEQMDQSARTPSDNAFYLPSGQATNLFGTRSPLSGLLG